jgi:hypothetical protein
MAAVLIGSGIAWASIPAPGGTINGCRKNTDGSMRVIDSTASCPSGYTALNWNQAGGVGALTVQANESVAYGQAQGTIERAGVNCPTGMVATGGGFVSVASLDEKWVPIASSPLIQSGQAVGWEALIEMEGTPLPPGSGNAVLTVYAVCLPTSA